MRPEDRLAEAEKQVRLAKESDLVPDEMAAYYEKIEGRLSWLQKGLRTERREAAGNTEIPVTGKEEGDA